MTKTIRKFAAAGLFLFVLSAADSELLAQTTVMVDVKVLELSRMEIEKLRTGTISVNFSKPLDVEQAALVARSPGVKIVHSLQLQGLNGKPTQLRVDSRVPINLNDPREDAPFFQIGIAVEVLPKASPNRDVVMATASQVKVGRGPAVNGGLPIVFETTTVKNETRIHEGESLVLGGFIGDTGRKLLPVNSILPDNPIVNYIYSKGSSPAGAEIVIVLTPHIVGNVTIPSEEIASPPKPPDSPPASAALSVPAISAPATGAPGPSVAATVPNAGSSALPRADSMAAPRIIPNPAPAAVSAAAANKPNSGAPIAPAEVGPPAALYTVQVGAFDSSDRAQAMVARVSRKYSSVFIDPTTTPPAIYRVRVGRLSNIKAARELQQRLSRDGYNTYIANLEEPSR